MDFYTDSSTSPKLGFGGYFGTSWFAGLWGSDFVCKAKPSIQYLELYAITVAIVLWAPKLANLRVTIFTDNKGAHDALNGTSSSCKNCMILIRTIAWVQLHYNVCFTAKYVESM